MTLDVKPAPTRLEVACIPVPSSHSGDALKPRGTYFSSVDVLTVSDLSIFYQSVQVALNLVQDYVVKYSLIK